jgi:hypothetical protein
MLYQAAGLSKPHSQPSVNNLPIKTQTMTPLDLQHWPLDKLIEYPCNPRQNDAVVDKMAGAIKEFGFRIPIVVTSDGAIVDGHLRFKAARKLNLETVPVVLADELTPAQIKAFRLLANQSSAWAAWDEELLKLELEGLAELEFDLTLTGFDEEEIERLLSNSDNEGAFTHVLDDDAETAPCLDEGNPPITEGGDIWILGRHRLLCGDSTDLNIVNNFFQGSSADMTVTARVREWFSNCRESLSIAAGFPWQCLTSPFMIGHPFSSHPTVRSVFPNTAVRSSSS